MINFRYRYFQLITYIHTEKISKVFEQEGDLLSFKLNISPKSATRAPWRSGTALV